MSTAKYEKLIDLILNEDQERAEQLFHEIVVEQSRAIYESLMENDEVGTLLDEIESEETTSEMSFAEAEDAEDDEEVDIEADVDDEDMEADMDDDEEVEVDDEMDDEESDMDMDDEEGEEEGEEEAATKSDIMNLEDKLDELMAEFEALMHGKESEEADMEVADTEEVMEAVEQKKVAVSHSDGTDSSSNKSAVPANSGAAGMAAKPPKIGDGDEKGRAAPAAKPMSSHKFKNAPGGGSNVDDGESAPKPKHETVKAKSPVPESRKITKKMVK